MTRPEYDAPLGGRHQQSDWGDEPRWTDPGWEPYTPDTVAPAPGAATPSTGPGGQAQSGPGASAFGPQPGRPGGPPRAVVVAGSVGGAGATTTALVLGAALAEQHRRPVAVLDASPAGGDLVARVFGSVRSPVPSWQQWARGGAEAATLRSLLVGGTPSVVVLGADPDASDGGALLPAAIEAATAEGWLVVIDAGSGAVAAPGLAAALAADAALAIAVPARAGDATRARWFFSALAMRYGSAAVADAVVAVVEQGEESSAVFAAVSRGLAGKVAATVAIPTDPQLVTGLQIDPRGIADSARTAAGALAQALTHTNAAARRPAR